ncbi:DUF3313 domain-containing protein [Citrobacter freundii]|nr:DUF3313 domain-containing protein [Citrobacter freundii]
MHQASFATGYWYYDRHRSVRLVILVGLAIDQIAQSGLSSLSVIYYSAQLFSFNESKYDNIVYNPITYYPVPKPTTQVGQQVLDRLLSYTNTQMKTSIGKRKPLVTTPGPRTLIFRGAITGVDTSKEGLQFYEVVPVALVVAGTQMATGHRTMDTHLYFEGELIDAATNKPVIKVVRKGEGKDLNNESTPMAFETLKKVVDDMATDASMFDVNKKQ